MHHNLFYQWVGQLGDSFAFQVNNLTDVQLFKRITNIAISLLNAPVGMHSSKNVKNV
jgi:hypothetical protein